MPTMNALEAKNAFGQFLDAAQRAPVTVTKNGRTVAALVSQPDLDLMAAAFLSEPLREAVAAGQLVASDALMQQAAVNRRLAEAEADIAAGRVVEADAGFFDDLRDHVRAAAAKR